MVNYFATVGVSGDRAGRAADCYEQGKEVCLCRGFGAFVSASWVPLVGSITHIARIAVDEHVSESRVFAVQCLIVLA